MVPPKSEHPFKCLDEKDSERISNLFEMQSLTFSDAVDILGLDPGKDFVNSDLSGIDFSGSDIGGFDFTGANLENCSFIGASFGSFAPDDHLFFC